MEPAGCLGVLPYLGAPAKRRSYTSSGQREEAASTLTTSSPGPVFPGDAGDSPCHRCPKSSATGEAPWTGSRVLTERRLCERDVSLLSVAHLPLLGTRRRFPVELTRERAGSSGGPAVTS